MNAMHAMPVTPLLLGPLMASVRLGRGRTLLACCCAAALGLAVGAGDLASARFGAEYGGLLPGCAVAPYLAQHRTSLEAALARARAVARSTQQLILRPISRDLAGIHVCTRPADDPALVLCQPSQASAPVTAVTHSHRSGCS
ncbi:hypothetical protein [Streptomyces sp. NPDC057403]|uniref:hypothetical protein n=1 Tax=Streptomyces sp. NPDC057403 TaxID=3346119 RepID=UPI0036963FBD